MSLSYLGTVELFTPKFDASEIANDSRGGALLARRRDVPRPLQRADRATEVAKQTPAVRAPAQVGVHRAGVVAVELAIQIVRHPLARHATALPMSVHRIHDSAHQT
jgi:hypothetical protein